MTELRASRREMERAFRDHKKVVGQGQGQAQGQELLSHKLLLVYALECGLKAALMRRVSVEEYHSLPEDHRFGHDLREALRLLRLPASLRINDTQTRQKKPQTVDPARLHQAWRYGINCKDEEELLWSLRAVLKWLEESEQ